MIPLFIARHSGKIAIIITITLMAVAIGIMAKGALKSERQAGAGSATASHNERTITNVKKANKAVEAIERDPALRNADCLRDSRTPENC